jgi:hypothetical protein
METGGSNPTRFFLRRAEDGAATAWIIQQRRRCSDRKPPDDMMKNRMDIESEWHITGNPLGCSFFKACHVKLNGDAELRA